MLNVYTYAVIERHFATPYLQISFQIGVVNPQSPRSVRPQIKKDKTVNTPLNNH